MAQDKITVKKLKGILESVKDDAVIVIHVRGDDHIVGYDAQDTRAQFGFFIIECDDPTLSLSI